MREHVYEGGLRYHAYRAGKYAFPNDEVEQNRDDMKHGMTLMLCRGEYFYAPVGGVLEGGGEVLDLGEFFSSVFFFLSLWSFLGGLLFVLWGFGGLGMVTEGGCWGVEEGGRFVV